MASQSPYGNLISSEQVEGTNVYASANREKVGEINHLMIDRQSGRVAYAVMSFGGFLGIGQDYHPVPWNALKYDTSLEGYVTGVTADQLNSAPATDTSSWSDRAWESRVHQHYNVPTYW
jgi:PRC-barrel domain